MIRASGAAQRSRLEAQVNAVTVAKAYRLLKAIFNTAVDDGLIGRNPRDGGVDAGQGPARWAGMPDLTDFQLEVTRLFFSLPASKGFLLAGGAALLAQHLTTRPGRRTRP